MKATRISNTLKMITSFFIILNFYGCVESVEQTELEFETTNSRNQNFGLVKSILKKNCISCHDSGSSLMLNYYSEQDFVKYNLVKKGLPTESKLYLSLKKNKYNSDGNMPPTNNLSSTELSIIHEWIVSLDSRLDKKSESFVYNCDDSALRNSLPNKIRKLSKTEYQNTFKHILGDTIYNSLSASIALLPKSVSTEAKHFQYDMTHDQIEIMVKIAENVSNQIVQADYFPHFSKDTCTQDSTISKTCIKSFIKEKGKLIYRRPLSAEEEERYLSLYETSSIPEQMDKIKTILLSMFLSPNFLFHFDLNNKKTEGLREEFQKRNQYEIASYMSYSLTQGPPDSLLIEAADNNLLNNIDQIKSHAKRIISSPEGKNTVGSFFYDWLELYRTAEAPGNNIFLDGLEANNLKEETVKHTQNFGSKLIIEKKVSLKELLSTKKIFISSKRIADLYGVAYTSGPGYYDVIPSRAGILSTPGVNLNGGLYSSIVTRGVRIRRNVICDKLPSPDFAQVALRDDIKPLDRSIASNRDYWEQFTMSDQECSICHSKINALGYPFEHIDSIGRSRSDEVVFSEDEKEIITHHPIDSKVNPKISLSDNYVVSTPESLGISLAKNYKVKACFAQKVFEHAFKKEINEKYNCLMNQLESKLKDPNYPLVNVFIDIVANKYSLARTKE